MKDNPNPVSSATLIIVGLLIASCLIAGVISVTSMYYYLQK